MTLLPPQTSAPGLTEEQLQNEWAWLVGFVRVAEQLDWTVWEGWWTQDAFMQFGNIPRLEGKDAIAGSHGKLYGALESTHHDFIRYSVDVPLGLIYLSSNVTFKVKQDPDKREIKLPAIAVIHKKIGESQTTGCEIYCDMAPVMSVVQEVLGRKAETG
ncbi:unnamed protein product [Rhizoctonia solani]|uniref:SnoaL-like domain-containing protein n=1 Tax=Rhizoctonia solani TaxID=456999 RepID=A0A8H2XDF6_9AGAM|nr:unnamed protein product [Rhizoctonia solani]